MAPKKGMLKRPAAAQEVVEPEEDDAEDEDEEEEEEEDEEEAAPAPLAIVRSPPKAASKSPPFKVAVVSSGGSPGAVVRRSPGKTSPGKAASASPQTGALVAQRGPLQIDYAIAGDSSSQVCEGLINLRRSNKLCDGTVIAGGGARIGIHRVVFAAASDTLNERLELNRELDLGNTSHEAAMLLVRWIYGEVSIANYFPSTPHVNEEVLRLSSQFSMPKLSELCSVKLAVGVTVTNVVARIRLCEEFGIPALRAALVQALITDKHALAVVSMDPATLAHPALMRELLASIARNPQ